MSNIPTNLLQMDQEEARLKELLQQLFRKKERAKKEEGEKLKDQILGQFSEASLKLLGIHRAAQNLEVSLEGAYTATLRSVVQDAGATGIALALIQQVLPDVQLLQAARDALGKNGTKEINELRAKEHLKEGKGRGLFFVWNEPEPSATTSETEEHDEPESSPTEDDVDPTPLAETSTAKPTTIRKPTK